MQQHKIFALLPLFMVIFLDIAGIILVLPVLTPLILQPSSGMIPAGMSMFGRDLLYGLSLSLFPFFMFFSTPIMGDLSDRFGRKKILMICLLGGSCSYIVGALGVIYQSLMTLLISRAIAGLAAGTQSIATAAIIDVSTPENKTKYLAWIVFISSIGVILGPIVGGLTTEKNLVSWFSYQAPFFIAAGVCLLNAVFLQYAFKESHTPNTTHAIDLTKGFTLFIMAFKEQKFRLLSLLYFCYVLAWSLYYQSITWFFMTKYHYTAAKLGLFVSYIGIICAITSAVLSRYILRMFKHEVHAYAFFVFGMALANVAAALSTNEVSQWMWVILNAAGDVVCYTISLNLFSNLADKDSQGWIMGVTGAIAAITWGIGGVIVGPLGYINISLPLWTAGGLCLISLTLTWAYRRSHMALT